MIELVNAFFTGQWPPTIVIGLALYWAISMKFKLVDQRFDQVNQQFEHVNQQFKQVNHRLDSMDKKLERLDGQGSQHTTQIAVLQDRVDRLFPDAPPLRPQLAEEQPAQEERAEEPAEAPLP